MSRDLDVVVFGATGFVGRLVAGHLATHAPAGARIGLAGRSHERLEAVRAGLPARARDWPLLLADSADRASLDRLAATTQVVATTVGPYYRHGLALVEACAAAGTDYADLTGEVLFVRQCIERCHDAAVASGARIVSSCGFDSVPSDLAVLLAHEQVRADGAGELTDAVLAASMKGGFSGGTIDSARVQLDAVRADPALHRVVADPYALSPDRAAEPDRRDHPDDRDSSGLHRDPDLGWTAPFVMAPYNTRIVRRSNALQDWAYGHHLRYREVTAFGDGPRAVAVAAAVTLGTAAAQAGMALRPTRAVLDRVLPRPGQGPDEQARRNGRFRMRLLARTTSGARYAAVVAARKDPGYSGTAVMLGEGALALALDRDRLPGAAGVLTPATALGPVLVDRLRAAGFELDAHRL